MPFSPIDDSFPAYESQVNNNKKKMVSPTQGVNEINLAQLPWGGGGGYYYVVNNTALLSLSRHMFCTDSLKEIEDVDNCPGQGFFYN